jgi:hypothetical protein
MEENIIKRLPFCCDILSFERKAVKLYLLILEGDPVYDEKNNLDGALFIFVRDVLLWNCV